MFLLCKDIINLKFKDINSRVMFCFVSGEDDLEDKVDLIICLGGDGTLLHASSLFQVN